MPTWLKIWMRAFNEPYAIALPIVSPNIYLLYDKHSVSNQADNWHPSDCVHPINFNIVNTKVYEKMKFTKLYKKHPSPISIPLQPSFICKVFITKPITFIHLHPIPSIFNLQNIHQQLVAFTHRPQPSPSHSIHLQSTEYSSQNLSPSPISQQ